MSKRQYSPYQRGLIRRYYEQLDVISLQKLQELVTELYLADSDAKRRRLWDRVEKAMIRLQAPEPIVRHILEKREVEILARNVQEWLKHTARK